MTITKEDAQMLTALAVKCRRILRLRPKGQAGVTVRTVVGGLSPKTRVLLRRRSERP